MDFKKIFPSIPRAFMWAAFAHALLSICGWILMAVVLGKGPEIPLASNYTETLAVTGISQQPSPGVTGRSQEPQQDTATAVAIATRSRRTVDNPKNTTNQQTGSQEDNITVAASKLKIPTEGNLKHTTGEKDPVENQLQCIEGGPRSVQAAETAFYVFSTISSTVLIVAAEYELATTFTVCVAYQVLELVAFVPLTAVKHQGCGTVRLLQDFTTGLLARIPFMLFAFGRAHDLWYPHPSS